MDLVSLTPGRRRPGAFGRRNNSATTQPARLFINARGDHVKFHDELRRQYLRVRGPEQGGNRALVPATNVGDVLLIARRYSETLMRANLTADDNSEIERWNDALARIIQLAEGREASELWPENPRFWQTDTRRLAIALRSIRLRPTPWELAVESVVETIRERQEDLQDLGSSIGPALAIGAGLVGLLVLVRALD